MINIPWHLAIYSQCTVDGKMSFSIKYHFKEKNLFSLELVTLICKILTLSLKYIKVGILKPLNRGHQ